MTPVPNKPKTPTSTFRLDPELMARVKVKAAANGETVTDVVRRALVNYVRRK